MAFAGSHEGVGLWQVLAQNAACQVLDLKMRIGGPRRRASAPAALYTGELQCDPLAVGATVGSGHSREEQGLFGERFLFFFFFLNYHQVSLLQKFYSLVVF